MNFRLRSFSILVLVALAASVRADNGHIISADSVSGITIDGDLSDWPDRMKNHFISNEVYVWNGVSSENGFLGRYRVGFDSKENAIYVAVEVEDDSVVLDSIGDQDWNSRDGCELFLSLDHSTPKTAPVQFVYRGKPYAVFKNAVNEELGKAVKAARASEDNQILYEWRVDVSALADESLALAAGAVIGFDVAYLDRDSEQSYAFYSSSPGSRKHLDSSQLGDLIVGKSSETVQLAGRTKWIKPNMHPPKMLNIRSADHDAIILRIPVLANGQFMASLPRGQYVLTAGKAGTNSVASQPHPLAIRKDTLLREPIEFEPKGEERSKVVVLYDLAHGQKELSPLKQLGEKLGFALKNSTEPLSHDLLKSVDLLYLLSPTALISPEERAAIVEFVKNGGKLLLVVDESRRMSLETTQVNKLVEPFGLEITGDTEYVHNCGGIAKAGVIHEHDLEIPYSGGRAVERRNSFCVSD